MQAERIASFDEETEGLTARAKSMMREDIDRAFQSRACVVEVCKLLQLMCEGHNVEMQDFLCSQLPLAHSANMVIEACLFLVALEPELDAANVEQGAAVLELLVELVQGNSSGGNAQVLRRV